MDEPLGPPKQAERVALAQLSRNSAFELILTVILLFGVTSIVRWVIGPSLIFRVIPQIHAELLIVGAAVALLLAGLILSPPGRASGGHMNPAISLAMWRFGVFPGAGVVPYTIAQLLGSVLGVLAVRALGRRRPDRDGHRTARHVYRGQREPGPPVRPGCRLWTDALPVGVSTSPDAGSSNRGMAATGDPAPPRRADSQAMRHRNGRTPAVRCPGLPRNALPSGTHGRSLTTWGGYVAIFICRCCRSVDLPSLNSFPIEEKAYAGRLFLSAGGTRYLWGGEPGTPAR